MAVLNNVHSLTMAMRESASLVQINFAKPATRSAALNAQIFMSFRKANVLKNATRISC